MKEEKLVTIDTTIEFFLCSILGKHLHGFAGHHPKEVWQNELKRLILHLSKYVHSNLVSDNKHMQHITDTLHQAEGAIDNGDDNLLIISLAKLCFLLLGDLPDHYRKSKVNRPEYYLLDKFRTLSYCQSPKQRADLIVHTYIYPEFIRNTDNDESEHPYLKYLKVYDKQMRHSEFIEWFRKEHPKKYLDLFS